MCDLTDALNSHDRDRVLHAPNGRTYICRREVERRVPGKSVSSTTIIRRAHLLKLLQLVPSDSASKDPVVQVNKGIVSKRKMVLEPEVAPFLDVILLSFIICHKEQEKQAAEGAAGAAG